MQEDIRFGIIGNGSWATALAKMLTDNNHHIHWWFRNEQSIQLFEQKHHNPQYLTSITFAPEKIKLHNNLVEVINACTHIVIAIPSAFVLQVISTTGPALWKGKEIISAIKGILPEQHQLLQQWLIEKDYCTSQNYYAISGPCHAEEVAAERLSYLTFAGAHLATTQQIANCFTTPYLRVTATLDLLGTQLAGVLKNIYAVGAGIAHGLDYGDNFLSVYITCCYREMCQVLTDLFEKENTNEKLPDYHTSAYLGDLLVTCYSLHSRNRTFGNMIGKGYSVNSALVEMKMVAEGYTASKGVQSIIKEHQLHAPIAETVYRILWEQHDPAAGFSALEQLFQ